MSGYIFLPGMPEKHKKGSSSAFCRERTFFIIIFKESERSFIFWLYRCAETIRNSAFK